MNHFFGATGVDAITGRNEKSVAIVNLHDKQVVETSFVVGTTSGGITDVGCQFDGGAIQIATGGSHWSCVLPNGSSTWRLGSKHTITAGILAAGALSATTSIQVIKGSNHDINGDGYPDFLVTAELNGSSGQVAAYVYYGGPSGISPTAGATLPSPSGSSSGGVRAVAALGDINGDGYADVVVGWPTGPFGGIYLYNGGSSGVSPDVGASLGVPSGDSNQNGYLTCAIAVGDINGDGYEDLVLGYYDSATGFQTLYLYNGAGTGLGITPSILSTPAGTGASIRSLAIGDLNGDGYADLVIGSDLNGSSHDGRVLVFNGGKSGISNSPTTTLGAPAGTGSNELFGSSVAIGDINGDGFGDLVVGAVGYQVTVGAVYVFNGGRSGVAGSPTSTLTGQGGEFGFSVAVGDTNGDGFADLAVGAYGGDGTNGGAVYLYDGGRSGLNVTAALTLTGSFATSGEFGYSLALSDFDGDGCADLAVGDYTSSSSFGGGVYLYGGGASGVSSSSATPLTDPAGGILGHTIAHDGSQWEGIREFNDPLIPARA